MPTRHEKLPTRANIIAVISPLFPAFQDEIICRPKIFRPSYCASTWTPTKTFADYTPLNKLPRVDLDVTAQCKKSGEENMTTVTIHNPTFAPAFAVHLKVNRASDQRVSREGRQDDEILPVLWQDNYFASLPGETRQVTATFRSRESGNAPPSVEIDGGK